MAINQKEKTDQSCVRYRNKFIPIVMKNDNIRDKYLKMYRKRRKPQPRKQDVYNNEIHKGYKWQYGFQNGWKPDL